MGYLVKYLYILLKKKGKKNTNVKIFLVTNVKFVWFISESAKQTMMEHLHISDFDSKIIRFKELVPVQATKMFPFHAEFSENNILCFPIICLKF